MKKPGRRYITGRRELSQIVREYCGATQDQADQMIDGTLGSIRAWILNAVASQEENDESKLLISGFGSFTVDVKRRGHRNAERLAAGLVRPAEISIRVWFRPCERVWTAIREGNSQLNPTRTTAIPHQASTNPSAPIAGRPAISAP